MSGLSADGAADLTRGDGPYAVLAIGLASGLPALARSGPSRGFPCQIRRGLWNLWAAAVRRYFCLSRQPTGVGATVAGAPAGAEACAPWRRRERPGGPP